MAEQYKQSYPSGPDTGNLFKSREQLIRIIKDLRGSLAEISWYMDHAFGCEIEQTDYCTCGKSHAKERARKLYDEIRYI